jgi:uncharacterized protein YkuJ
MKKIILAAAALIAFSAKMFAGTDPIVGEKVLEAFKKTFLNVKEVSWSEMPQAYEVKFKQDQITARVTYDRDGNILKTIRYYSENQLPILVLTKLKNKYSDKKVFGVTEVSSDEGVYYHIVLEDEKDWTNVKADSYGSMTVESKLKKA